jgi:hypothetical protein
MIPKWLRLLQALPGYPNIALQRLTVAFYVGSARESLDVREASAEEALHELENLVGAFVEEAPPEKVVRIFRCGSIKQPVVELMDALYCSATLHGIESKSQGRRTLVFDPEFAPVGLPSVQGVAEKLYQELGEQLRASHFSYDKGHYRPFTDKERQFIQEI